MKKIRLLLLALAGFLALVGYAMPSDEDWVKTAKQMMINWCTYDPDNVYVAEGLVYHQAISFANAEEKLKKEYHPVKGDKPSFKIVRTLDDSEDQDVLHSDFAFILKPDKSTPYKQRPEYSMKFSNTIITAYNDTVYHEKFDSIMEVQLRLLNFQSNTSVKSYGFDYKANRGGLYRVSAANNVGTGYNTRELKLLSDPICRMNIRETEAGFAINSWTGVKVTVGSGYPYETRIKDYQNTSVTLSVKDADNKEVLHEVIKLNASPDSTDMEYFKEVVFPINIKSRNYTFTLTGSILKQPIEIKKDTKVNYSNLNEAIVAAQMLSSTIKRDSTMAHLVGRAEQLTEAAEEAQEVRTIYTTLEYQPIIDMATERLVEMILAVQRIMKRKPVEVKTAKELRDAIVKDDSAQIVLLCDIDMKDITEPIRETFYGSIYGGKEKHALIGRRLRSEYGSDSQATSHFFDYVKGAVFSNLTLKQFRIEADKSFLENKNGAGVISRNAKNCIFRNIRVEDASIYSALPEIGTITGYATSCLFDSVYVTRSSVTTDYRRAGGITGTAYNGDFRKCYVDTTVSVFANGNGFWNLGSLTYEGESGGFSGVSSHSTFRNCENHGLVGGDYDYLGGFVGLDEYSHFYDCINTGRVISCNQDEFRRICEGKSSDFDLSKKDYMGGICGFSAFGVFSRCSNYGHIYTKEKTAGGILGRANSGVLINNCLNAEDSGENCAGIVGVLEPQIDRLIDGTSDEPSTITNCLSIADRPIIGDPDDYLDPQSGNNYSLLKSKRVIKAEDREMGVTEEMLTSGVVARWLNNGIENREDGITPWRQNIELKGKEKELDAHPVLDPSHRLVTVEQLTSGNVITSAAQLQAFAALVNSGNDNGQFACACLGADIDMSEVENFTPIGLNQTNKHFRGIFDGRGHTISNLTVTRDGEAGLFGAVHTGAEIYNVIVGDGSTITSNSNGNDNDKGKEGAGGIVGRVAIGWPWGNVIIESCGSYATINVNKHGGGILGRVSSNGDNDQIHVHVKNCFNMGIINAYDGDSGLLCGYTKYCGHVSDSWSGGQLRLDQSHPTWPYSIKNPKNQGEYLVGYDKKLDIKDCFIINLDKNVDKYGDKIYAIQDGVKELGDADVTTGSVTYVLNGYTNDVYKNLRWEQNLGTDPYPVLGNRGVYHTRDLNEEFGTICLPFAVKSDDYVTYYKLESVDLNEDWAACHVRLVEVPQLEAGEAGIFHVKKLGMNYTFRDAGTKYQDTPQDHEIWGFPGNRWIMKGTMGDKIDNIRYNYYTPIGHELKAPQSIAPYSAYIEGADPYIFEEELEMPIYLVNSVSPYDVNFDNEVNVADVPAFINQGNAFTPFILGTNAENRTKLTNVILEK